MGERIGILGGTFNPVHVGHLVLAQDAYEKMELDRVLMVPSAQPPHKDGCGLAPAHHRAAMVEAAVEGDPRLSVSLIEMDRGGLSWTVDTLRTLRGLHPAADLVFIIGEDTVGELHTWRSIDEIFGLCRFAVAGRPGFVSAVDGVEPGLSAEQSRRLRLARFAGHAIDLSSTEIRMRVAEGLSIRYLVPDSVAMYIAEHRLYVE